MWSGLSKAHIVVVMAPLNVFHVPDSSPLGKHIVDNSDPNYRDPEQ